MGLSCVWLKEHNIVIFRYILTKLHDKVYILLFNSCVKFHAKFACIAENQQKWQGIAFYTHTLVIKYKMAHGAQTGTG